MELVIFVYLVNQFLPSRRDVHPTGIPLFSRQTVSGIFLALEVLFDPPFS
jgi:hypothetical protein